MKDRSPLVAFEVESSLSDGSLGRLLRAVIDADGQIRDSHRMYKHLYLNTSQPRREPVQFLIQIPRDSVEKFKNLWNGECYSPSVPSIPDRRQRIQVIGRCLDVIASSDRFEELFTESGNAEIEWHVTRIVYHGREQQESPCGQHCVLECEIHLGREIPKDYPFHLGTNGQPRFEVIS